MKTNQEIVDESIKKANEYVGYALESSKARHMLANTYAALALVEIAAWALREDKP